MRSVRKVLMANPQRVFTREATGLIRAWSSTDALYYNFLTSAITGLTFYSFIPPEFPGADMVTGVLTLTIASIPFFITYAMLAASMPRTGGDYVFQSRILHPALGFSMVQMGQGLFPFGTLLGAAFGGWFMVENGIAPMLMRYGMLYNNQGLTNLGIWTTTSWGLFSIEVAVIVITTITLLVGMKAYVKIQWIQLLAVVGAIVAMYVAVLSMTNSSFISAVNTSMGQLGNGQSFYSATIVNATAMGYNPNPSFNLYSTIGVWPVFWGTAAWYAWSVFQAGEIKNASNVKNQVYSMIGSLLLMSVGVYVIIGWLFLNVSGTAFFNAFSYISFTGNLTHFLPGIPPNIPSLLILVLTNPILIALIGIGYIFQSYQICINSTLPATRTAMAAAFDRVYPEFMADVNERFHVPLKAIIVCAALAILNAALLNFSTLLNFFVLAFLSVVPFTFTMLAAALFPFRKSVRSVYEASPIAKYKIGSVPIITITGLWGVFLMVLMVYYNIVTPALIPNTLSWETMIFGWIAFVAIYYLMVLYRRRQGIDISLAFKLVPPE